MKQKPYAKAQNQYTDYFVREPMELMEFLASKMPQASRTKLKSLLTKRVVFVDNVITTQYNFPLQPGMKVQISRDKHTHEFRSNLVARWEYLPGSTLYLVWEHRMSNQGAARTAEAASTWCIGWTEIHQA